MVILAHMAYVRQFPELAAFWSFQYVQVVRTFALSLSSTTNTSRRRDVGWRADSFIATVDPSEYLSPCYTIALLGSGHVDEP
jgi:hypothetical protein